jgi:hypothetical protein
VLTAVRAERCDLPVPPRRHIEHEIDPGCSPRRLVRPTSHTGIGGIHTRRVTMCEAPVSGYQRGSAAAVMASAVKRLMAM